MDVRYSGLVCDSTYADLRGRVMAAIADAPAAVIWYDKALLTLNPDVDIPQGVETMPPAAVIVLPEQMEFWRSYAKRLAGVGVMRAIFLPGEAQMAYRWAESVAVAMGRSRRSRAESALGSHR